MTGGQFIERISVFALRAYPFNARTHSDAQVQQIADSRVFQFIASGLRLRTA